MITYPYLNQDATIGVTAPSSGVPTELHPLLHSARERLTKEGYHIQFGETAWTQSKAKSAPAQKRAAEFNQMIRNNDIDMIIPPWGGELFIEALPYLSFNDFPSKWILGYSDTSALLLAITLQTGVATAHGTNLVDLRGVESDETTRKWKEVCETKRGESVVQHSSRYFQKEWDFENPSPHIFHLTEQTEWKTLSGEPVTIKGRLLGGCIDVCRHLIGTPFGNIETFQEESINSEPILWYFENCQLSTTDLRRTLVQMKLAGWFDQCSGLLFGRSPSNDPVGDYEVEDVYRALSEELQIPVVYDIDCGHVPPQMTFVNGALAEVEVKEGKGKVVQTFC